jgi:predicted SnoaL-like aldol condensation-catalyzing enzyme
MRHSRPFHAASRVGFGMLMLIACSTLLASAPASTYTAQEQANLKLVTDFFAALDEAGAQNNLKQKIRSIVERYMSPDYKDHDGNVQRNGPGREGFIRMFEGIPPAPPAGGSSAPRPAPKVVAIMADGALVNRLDYSTRSGPDGKPSTHYSFDMYRIENGRLAEHWTGSSDEGQPASGPSGQKAPQR